MELYKVKLEHKDVAAQREWDQELERACRSPQPPRLEDTPPMPKRIAVEGYAAVLGDFGGDPVRRAADLVVRRLVGPPERWEEYQPCVLAVEYLGSVGVEEMAERTDREEERDG